MAGKLGRAARRGRRSGGVRALAGGAAVVAGVQYCVGGGSLVFSPNKLKVQPMSASTHAAVAEPGEPALATLTPPAGLTGANARGSRLRLGASRADGSFRRQRISRRRAFPEVDLSTVQTLIDQVPDRVAELGDLGPLYFFAVYVVAECLALPAAPLTLSAGYLFGTPVGCAVSLLAGSTAAGIGFLLSRTLLAPYVRKLVADNETFQGINRAVEREGFKIILLLRLSPLLPFALSNYVYGLSNVSFQDFLAATMLGFAPGTCAIVYFASSARDMMAAGSETSWYTFAAGALLTACLLKIVGDITKQAVDKAMEESAATT